MCFVWKVSWHILCNILFFFTHKHKHLPSTNYFLWKPMLRNRNLCYCIWIYDIYMNIWITSHYNDTCQGVQYISRQQVNSQFLKVVSSLSLPRAKIGWLLYMTGLETLQNGRSCGMFSVCASWQQGHKDQRIGAKASRSGPIQGKSYYSIHCSNINPGNDRKVWELTVHPHSLDVELWSFSSVRISMDPC